MKNHYFSVIKFPAFVSLSLIFITALLFGLAITGYRELGWGTLETMVYGLLFTALIILIGSWLMVLSSTHRKIINPGLAKYLNWILFHVFYHLSRAMNAIFFQSRVSFWESFLNFNNEIVLTNHQGTHHDKVLLLLPHCLQSSQCKIRVTADIINCEECGACDIAKLKTYSKEHNIQAAVASGGSMARKLITDLRPSVIVAVACHRDLVEGTRDAWKLPVYAVLNERPNGPCFETTVSMKTIEFAINKFI